MHQFVTLTRGGEQVKQSHARGQLTSPSTRLLEEVGADVFRFFMVQRRAESRTSTSTSTSRRTPTGRRTRPTTCSTRTRARTAIERKARERGVAMPDAASVDAARLVLPEEIEILKKIGELPEVVERAARDARAAPRLLLRCASWRGSGTPTNRTACATACCRTTPR